MQVFLKSCERLYAGITGEIKIGVAKSSTEIILGIDYK